MNKNKLRLIRLILVVLMVACIMTACSQKDVQYNFIDNDSLLTEGERDDATGGEFDNIGIYTDPELEIDGVRDEEYDYPTGSGRHEVYIEGNEQTYVSIYKGESAIYFLFECKDEYLSALTVEDINISTAQSDSVELYLSTYGLGGKTMTSTDYEFRVSVASRVYSYLTGFVAKVFTYGTVNDGTDIDEGFNVEGYISYSVLGADVDKYTPTSFAFARVTKTGNTGFVWHGAVDPKVPDNYLTLHTDNKFYTLDECPVSATVSGTVKDLNNDPVALAKVVTSAGEVGFTDTNGNYRVKLEGTDNFSLSFEKNGYLTYVHTLSKKEIIKEQDISYNQVLLKEEESYYNTVFEGKITERDGVTPIAGATVTVNESSATTDSEGKYSFEATCFGYDNQVTFAADGHSPYTKTVEFAEIAVGQTTAIQSVALDENYGSTMGFGDSTVGFGQARVLRNEDNKSFKVLFKTAEPMDGGAGSYFELFIDTKDSSAFEQRDGTDYRLDISYTDGLVGFQNYGDLTLPRTGFSWTSGRINDLYFVEADIDYDFIGVEPDEIFGLYFAIKCNWNWAGMYDHNNKYIQAEYPRNYLRLDVDSTLFSASANAEPVPSDTVTYLNEIGNFPSVADAVKYGVSVYRDDKGVTIVLEQRDASFDMVIQAHSLNVYVDTDYDGSNRLDEKCYHLSIYPGRAVAAYRQYNENGLEQNKYNYEENINARFEVRYKNKLYIHLSYEIFGGSQDSVIAFALGYWNDAAATNDYLIFNGQKPDFADPSTFIKVAPDGTVTIGG